MRGLLKRLFTRATSRVLLSGAPGPETRAERHTRSRRMVVGLGNPGMKGTRHSVGMAVLGALATRLGVADVWRVDKQVSGEVIESKLHDVHVVLLRPRLLMNINGVAVAKAAAKYSVRPEDVLLVHDELDKPLGKVGVKHGGSARGHNGVRSCVDCLQTDVMLRLRVGVGRPAGRTPVDRWVLGVFSPEEQKVLGSVLDQSVDLILSQITDSMQSPSSPAGSRAASRKPKPRAASLAEGTAAPGPT